MIGPPDTDPAAVWGCDGPSGGRSLLSGGRRMRFGTGPVFAYERLTASRRWQGYALRSFGVAALLVAMGAIAAS